MVEQSNQGPIAYIIAYCARHAVLTVIITLLFALWGYRSLMQTPLDAIPDLSDVQVIIYSEWPGRSPDLVEDQVT